ncbi:MAG: trypsin-like serine protease [Myxococcota bacterium]
MLHGLLALVVAWNPELTTRDVLPSFGGQQVETCGFPSVVAVADDVDAYCSGTLVAPDVVLFAGHCILELGDIPPTRMLFGESVTAPARSIPVTDCAYHPEFTTPNQQPNHDVAYCLLAEAVEDVPIIPIAAGCELEGLVEGIEGTAVGFGADSIEGSGFGLKRQVSFEISEVDTADGGLWGMGADQDTQGICGGDSGGPLFARLADGQLRLVGVASLGSCGDAPAGLNDSGYAMVAPDIEWLESASGRDLTPCFDGDAWAPTEACTGFALDPEIAAGTWERGCIGGGQQVDVQTCAEAGADESGGPGESSGGDDASASTSGGDVGEQSSTGDGSSDGTGSPQAEGGVGTEGCSCRSDTEAPSAWWMLLLLPVVRPRRRIRVFV